MGRLQSPINKFTPFMFFPDSHEDITDNQILNNLEEDCDMDPDLVIDEDEDPETLLELEHRKEEIMEEFLELAY